jgi:hypothetical protein
MEDTILDALFDVDGADSSPSFSPGPAYQSPPPTTTKSGRKSTPRKRKSSVAKFGCDLEVEYAH